MTQKITSSRQAAQPDADKRFKGKTGAPSSVAMDEAVRHSPYLTQHDIDLMTGAARYETEPQKAAAEQRSNIKMRAEAFKLKDREPRQDVKETDEAREYKILKHIFSTKNIRNPVDSSKHKDDDPRQEPRPSRELNLTEADRRALFWRERLLVPLCREAIAEPDRGIFYTAACLAIEGKFAQVKNSLEEYFGDTYSDYVQIACIVVDNSSEDEYSLQNQLLLDTDWIIKQFTQSKLIGKKDEGLLSNALKQYFEENELPPQLWQETAAEIERVIRKQLAKNLDRPLWADRARYPDLAELSSPAFLKRVWSDAITPDGAIEKEMVRQADSTLMVSVENYISKRQRRKLDAGDAAGLSFIARPLGRHAAKIASQKFG